MKRSAGEKNPARANNELSFILSILLLITLCRFGNNFFPGRKAFTAEERFAEMVINRESALLDLSKIKNARNLDNSCPNLFVEELDAVIVSDNGCELKKQGASNWVRFAMGKKMLLNRAEANDLEFLFGIGKKRAEEILNLRQNLNGFESMDQLKRLPWMNERYCRSHSVR